MTTRACFSADELALGVGVTDLTSSHLHIPKISVSGLSFSELIDVGPSPMTGRDLFFEDRRRVNGDESGVDKPAQSQSRSKGTASGGAVWDDEDDFYDTVPDGVDGKEESAPSGRKGGAGFAGVVNVDIKGVAKRRKLRKSASEAAVSGKEYQRRIREYHTQESSRIASGTWAEVPSKRLKKRRRSAAVDNDNSDPDSDAGYEGSTLKASQLMQSTGNVLSARASVDLGAATLSPGTLDIRRVTDANKQDPNKAVVQAVEFHPSGRLLMTAGHDKTMRLFQVDGKRNAKIQGVRLEDLPISSAHFTGGGSEVVMMGRRPFFYQFDLEGGAVRRIDTLARGHGPMKSLEMCIASPDGSQLAVSSGDRRLLLMSNKTKQQTGVLRMNFPCSAAEFSRHNENHIFTATKGGAVFLWDVRKHACVDRHVDEGALSSTCISTSESHYAIGSNKGVVNLYRHSAMRGVDDDTVSRGGDRMEQPEKAFMNLVTGISALKFNSDGQLLALASRAQKNAVRLVHIPSMTVYSNWPTENVNLRRVSCLAFSPSGGYLATGNDKGEALLFRIRSGYPAL